MKRRMWASLATACMLVSGALACGGGGGGDKDPGPADASEVADVVDVAPEDRKSVV